MCRACGRKGYWWIIALTFGTEPITALSLTLSPTCSPPLIPPFHLLLSPFSSLLFYSATHVHTHTHAHTHAKKQQFPHHMSRHTQTIRLKSWGEAKHTLNMNAKQRILPCCWWLPTKEALSFLLYMPRHYFPRCKRMPLTTTHTSPCSRYIFSSSWEWC